MANIMVVDRSPFMRGSLKFLVERLGNTVVCDAESAAEAARLYDIHRPEIVLLELLMEGALDLLKKIREITPAVKVAIAAPEGDEKLKKEAESGGASGRIEKPYKSDNVAVVLKSLGQQK